MDPALRRRSASEDTMSTDAIDHSASAEMQATRAALFLKTLIAMIRAEDTHGVWESKSDETLLAPYIVTKEMRREIPIIGDPDPDVMARVDLFYKAIGLAVEKETGLVASPMMKMSHEGFGRVVLIAGHLVVLSKHLRDIHRFGFESMEKLGAEGAKMLGTAVKMMDDYPDVAQA
jgi:probable nitrogen fixation protein